MPLATAPSPVDVSPENEEPRLVSRRSFLQQAAKTGLYACIAIGGTLPALASPTSAFDSAFADPEFE